MILGELNARQVDRIVKMLTGMPAKIRNKILRRELRNAAKKLKPSARSATPVASGKLRRSVKVRAAKRSRKGIGVLVGYNDKPYSGDTFYGAFLEWGYRWGKRRSAKTILRESRRRRRLTDAQRAQVKAENDTRKKIPGKYMLTKVADANGPAVLDQAIVAIGKAIQDEDRNA